MTLKQLANELGITRQRVSQVLGTLIEGMDYHTEPRARRTVRIVLTESGIKKIRERNIRPVRIRATKEKKPIGRPRKVRI